MILTIIFWISLVLLIHSYLLFPLIVQIFARNKPVNKEIYRTKDSLPLISIIMSVHNEENIIVEKIKSIYYTFFPAGKFEVLIGSDASTDGTNRICQVYESNYDEFHFYPFQYRQGKPAVINQLMRKAKGEIVILTDAKVIFSPDTIYELVKHFKNKEIDIVGGNIINEKVSQDGISRQEKAFMNREIIIKYNEGKLWGHTIGVYGAVYAIRKSAFTPVPDGFSVDDFFITLSVIKKKGKVIMNPEAITKEDVPNRISIEFKRKVRISSGNYQNLAYFRSCLWPPFSSLSFAFFSHKVIRWIGPFLLIILFCSNILLLNVNLFYQISFFIQAGLLILPIIDQLLKKVNIHIAFLRFITHFLAMNLALLVGFIKYVSGSASNIWQPTRR